MVETFAASTLQRRSSLWNWIQRHDPGCHSSFVHKDEFLSGNAVDSISCSRQINETKCEHNPFVCEEDFVSKSRTCIMAASKRNCRMHRDQISLKSRTVAASNVLLSYVVVIVLLLALLANVSLSASHDDLCLNVTWSAGSTLCNCSIYSLNFSSCTNISRFDELAYSCWCGDSMVCSISDLNSTDSEPLVGNCSCSSGYTGQHCDMPLVNDHCANVSCQNGATCLPDSSNSSYWCKCPVGFTGTQCEWNINECNATSLCQNNGTCVDGIGGHTCNCTEGYEGFDCSRPNCTSVICHNNDFCSINGSHWFCNCVMGYEGEICADLDACFFNPCQNNGTCENWNNTYNCSCIRGFMGVNCSETDYCDAAPCVNGTCHNTNKDYECSCVPGFTGVNCSDVDHCASHPCFNGTCSSINNAYNCSCSAGFIGEKCEIVDPCVENPCVNGFCTPLLMTGNCSSTYPCYFCTCSVNYTGVNCDTLIGGSSPSSDNSTTVALIVGLTVGLFVLLVIIVAVILALIVRNKRRNLGTYHPSRQEVANARLEINGGLKPPPEERLI